MFRIVLHVFTSLGKYCFCQLFTLRIVKLELLCITIYYFTYIYIYIYIYIIVYYSLDLTVYARM